MDFELILIDRSGKMADAFRQSFSRFEGVQIRKGRFELVLEYDCVVSPANSFGLMDGGMDQAIVDYFGLEVARRVQTRILSEYAGDQPVGTCFIVETGDAMHPFLAHSPTMRYPKDIRGTENAYYAMKAMLLAIKAHNKSAQNKINSVVCPGLGALTGGLSPETVAAQMALAYEHALNPPARLDWFFAAARDNAIEAVRE